MIRLDLEADDGFMEITIPLTTGGTTAVAIDVAFVNELMLDAGAKSAGDTTQWKVSLGEILRAQGVPDLSYHQQFVIFKSIRKAADDLQKKSGTIPEQEGEPESPITTT